MDEPFNPYVEWLGLTASTEKPDHYRLLGLPPFESDARRITSACDGMLAKVRGNRPGSHVREWQALLDELTAARNCLLDDEARSKYDKKLREGDDSAPAAEQASPPAASASGGSNYMWPPGYQPPAPKLSPAPASSSPAPAPASPAPSAPAAAPSPLVAPYGQTAPTVSASESTNSTDMSTPSQNTFAPYSAPATVPVLTPGVPTAGPPGAPVSNQQPGYTQGTPFGSPGYSSPGSSPAPTPTQQNPQPYSAGNYNTSNYNYSTNTGYLSSGAPMASPYGSAPTASPIPPGSAYGNQGVDPMAPVAGPANSAGSVPLAQPITGYGQSAPVAYPAGGYGQGYSQPQAQPTGMNYGSPVAQAMPVSSMPTAGVPGGAFPGSGMPVAAAAVPSPLQAMPTQAATPMKAIPVAAAEPELGLKVPSSSTTKAYKSRKNNSVSVAIAAVLAASLLVVAAFFAAIKDSDLLAKKPDLPRSASELPIPTDVPPPVDPYATKPPSEMLDPLGEDNPQTNAKRPKRPKIGPLVDEGQTPETIPMIGPDVKKSEPPESAIPSTMKPEETAPVSTASPKETAAVRKALGQALVAMGFRDWDTAKDKVEEAKALATDELLKEKVEAVDSVSTGVQEFWRAVKESTKSLGAGQELVIANTRVAVVEASDKLLILRVGGMNKRYPIDDLPMGLARTLASSWFDNNAASTKVFTGAFLFVEPNGDPAEVRQLWQAAKQQGVNMDLLMPLLEDDLKAEAKEESDKS